MCYDSAALSKRSLDYAKRVGYGPETIEELEQQFLRLREISGPVFHANGYDHPALPIVLEEEEKKEVKLFQWGLVPQWTKNLEQAQQVWNRTLNARSETIFEKPAYREAAEKRRCLVVLDGFYEHHHKGSRTFPYYIQMANKEPMIMAGIYERWLNPEDQNSLFTFSIVTTQANSLLQKIHNNPKMKEARIPLILSREKQELWLSKLSPVRDKKTFAEIFKPIASEELIAHTVAPLRGMRKVGNVPIAQEEKVYPELMQEDSDEHGQISLF
ncbi:MAG: SOS response-associated peptidase [Bacteroidetes bacterium]|nr:MAG: SOS response-associated peptidase [Bacteroidota bacterium]